MPQSSHWTTIIWVGQFLIVGYAEEMCHLLGLVRSVNKESRKKEDLGGASISLDSSLQTVDFNVRIVHAGGREEQYQNAVPASQLMKNYPGMCVARPDVFKNPHKSLLRPEEKLLPGQKYYLIPCTTAQKLKRKHPEKVEEKETVDGKVEISDGEIANVIGDNLDESICSAKDFYVSRERRSGCSRKQRGRGKKKPFVPPIPKGRLHRELVWEPSLTSIQEISP